MNFFLTNNISESMSGIEHAQIKRLHLFHDEGGEAMIVTVKHWTNTHTVLEHIGILTISILMLLTFIRVLKKLNKKKMESNNTKKMTIMK